jgi:5-methylcytosine-specific restriction enzyme A
MARTQGHGNPNWTREETILALDLYFDCQGKVPSKGDSRVLALSALLRGLPYHQIAARKASFRNPVGVTFKLQNLRQVATGKGLENVSDTDRKVWMEFGTHPGEVKRIATLIIGGINSYRTEDEAWEDEEFFEGRLLTETHKRRERNPGIRKKLLATRRKNGELKCDMCGASSQNKVVEFQDAIFEAHHVIPLSHAGERKTLLKDMALLCANCHRLLHRAISKKKKWLGIKEGRDILAFD